MPCDGLGSTGAAAAFVGGEGNIKAEVILEGFAGTDCARDEEETVEGVTVAAKGVSMSMLEDWEKPTFLAGTYKPTNVAYGANTPGTLVISTPEPSLLLLLTLGFLAVAAGITLKKAAA